MVTKTVKIVVCDKCGEDRDTERYSITFPGDGRRSLDLCEKCRAPLEELAALFINSPKPGPRYHGRPVVDEKTVEAQRKKPPKKPRKAPVKPR